MRGEIKKSIGLQITKTLLNFTAYELLQFSGRAVKLMLANQISDASSEKVSIQKIHKSSYPKHNNVVFSALISWVN
jgi:hypothetical protein